MTLRTDVLDGARLAVTTLTVVPLAGPARLDRDTAGWAMRLAPLVGVGLAAVAAGALTGLDALTVGPPLLAATATVAVLASLTRGLHLDGLADLADGLGSYSSPERSREVMKSPEVGALGVCAVVLVLALQVAALLACVSAGRGVTGLVLAVVTGRLAVTVACTAGVPAAAPGGLGALVAGTVPPHASALAALLVVGAGTAVAALDGAPLWLPTVAVAAGLGAAHLVRRHAVRRLGGITGDVLGALVELTTTVVLLTCAISL